MIRKAILAILLFSIFAAGLSATRTTHADSQYQINIHVTNSLTSSAESDSICTFTFNPSGNTIKSTTDSSGTAQATESSKYDTTVDVSCTGTDGNIGTVTDASLSAQQGDTVQIILSKLVVPSPVQSIQASAASFGTGPVTLTWKAPSSNGGSPVRDYYIYKGASQGAETFFARVPGDTLTYMDDSTSPGSSYYYYVTAANAAGSSQPSSEVSLVISCFGDGGAFCN